MIKWFKKLKNIVKNYDGERDRLLARIELAEKTIRDRTDIHADIHYKSENQIIVIGRYGKTDYIQTFNIHRDDFKGLVEQIRKMERYGHVARVDAPPLMHAVIERELKGKTTW